jgi:hypothetical protein
MKRRNWAMLVLLAVGLAGFFVIRSVSGPPAQAAAAETTPSPELSDPERRYMQSQKHHWKYVMLRQDQ